MRSRADRERVEWLLRAGALALLVVALVRLILAGTASGTPAVHVRAEGAWRPPCAPRRPPRRLPRLGPAVADAPATRPVPSSLPAWSGAVALLLLLAEWASRRARGAA